MKLIVKYFDDLTPHELYKILQARVSIFVVEQNCPYQEIDGKDLYAYHMWLEEDGNIKAYLRILDKGLYHDEVAVGRVITTERGNVVNLRFIVLRKLRRFMFFNTRVRSIWSDRSNSR